MFNKTVLMLALFASAFNVAAQPSETYPSMTNEGFDHMAGTFAFYNGQVQSVEAISRMFPELETRLRQAQARFDVKFASSISNIDAILGLENTTWLNGGRERMLSAIREQFDPRVISYADPEAAVDQIERRASGDLPSPYLETLLIYNPDFIARPAEEMIRGYREVFRSADHPKSKGVDFQVEFPTSWAPAEGRRPNVITVYDSENGRGLEKVLLMVKELPFSPAEIAEVEGAAALILEGMSGEAVPEGGVLIAETEIRLDGLPGIKTVFQIEQDVLDYTVYGIWATYSVIFENKIIMLQCSVSATNPDQANLSLRFDKFKTLFDLIAGSLVVQSQWE